MTTTVTAPADMLLTYEAYMAEPETKGRYDIINGVRIFMSGATWDHQVIAGNLFVMLRAYIQASGIGKVLASPFDVLIRRLPKLQTRQPDILCVSYAKIAQVGGRPKKGPLEIGPELVVEIVSDSETQRILGDKIADYCSIGVEEAWVIRPDAGTVEVLRLTPGGASSEATYGDGETVVSVIFPSLAVPVADILAP